MMESRKQCRNCIYFGHLAPTCGGGMKACNYYLITKKRRKVSEDGITCLSKEKREDEHEHT